MELEFESSKCVNRNFYCSNRLWSEMKQKTKGIISLSTYIKHAVIEKMTREDPKNKEYYESLFFL